MPRVRKSETRSRVSRMRSGSQGNSARILWICWRRATKEDRNISYRCAWAHGRLSLRIPARLGLRHGSDLSTLPISGIPVVMDGDAHMNNFGMYGTPQQQVVFDLNDFDEATIGPWEWDLKRLVASVNVAGRRMDSIAASGLWQSGAA